MKPIKSASYSDNNFIEFRQKITLLLDDYFKKLIIKCEHEPRFKGNIQLSRNVKFINIRSLTVLKIQSFTEAQGAYLDSSDVFCKSQIQNILSFVENRFPRRLL